MSKNCSGQVLLVWHTWGSAAGVAISNLLSQLTQWFPRGAGAESINGGGRRGRGSLGLSLQSGHAGLCRIVPSVSLKFFGRRI